MGADFCFEIPIMLTSTPLDFFFFQNFTYCHWHWMLVLALTDLTMGVTLGSTSAKKWQNLHQSVFIYGKLINLLYLDCKFMFWVNLSRVILHEYLYSQQSLSSFEDDGVWITFIAFKMNEKYQTAYIENLVSSMNAILISVDLASKIMNFLPLPTY